VGHYFLSNPRTIKTIQILNWDSRLLCGVYDFFLCFATFFYRHIYTFNIHLIYSSVTICICPWHFVLLQLQQQNHMTDLHEGFLEKFNKLSLLKRKMSGKSRLEDIL